MTSGLTFKGATHATPTRSTMDALEHLQATLDDQKDDLSDGDYLKMCNCCEELHAV